MAANSFGTFGTFKLKFLNDAKKIPQGSPIDVSDVSHVTLKDIEYFQKNLARTDSNQIVNYTWEKSSEESPSFYTQHPGPEIFSKTHQHTLEQMATYKGYPHVIKQSRWESEPNAPPDFKDSPQKRRTAVLSAMTIYQEEMNKTFPGLEN